MQSESALPVLPVEARFDACVPIKLTSADLSRLSERTDPAAAQSVWREAQARELAANDPEVLGTFITRTAYRLVREWSRTCGALASDEFLSDLTIDQFLVPRSSPPDCPRTAFSISAFSELRAVEHNGSNGTSGGIPLLPSTVNDRFPMKISEAFTRIMGHISCFLKLDETDYGPPSLPYLLQTPPNPLNWPDAYRLQEYEIHLVGEVLDILLDKGTRNAKLHLKDQHCFRDHEINALIRLAKIESRRRMDADIEEERAVLSMRLEDLIARSREALDMRVELGAIKQLAIVQGVTRAEPEDAMTEFANVIRKVTNEAAPALPAAPEPVDALEAPSDP